MTWHREVIRSFFINFATKLYGGSGASTYNIDKTLMTKSRTKKIMAVMLFVFISLVLTKSIWVMYATSGHGSFDEEKKEIIRRAFVSQFDDHLARHYYIDGLRGEPKKNALPRDLVVWE